VLSHSLQEFHTIIERSTAHFLELSARRRSVFFKRQIQTFLQRVATLPPNSAISKFRAKYHQFAVSEREARGRIERATVDTINYHHLNSLLSHQLGVLNELNKEVEIVMVEREEISGRFLGPLRQYDQSMHQAHFLHAELPNRRAQIAELSEAVRAVISERSGQCKAVTDSLLGLLDEFSRFDTLCTFDHIVKLMDESPGALIDWKKQILEHLEKTEKEKSVQLADLQKQLTAIREQTRQSSIDTEDELTGNLKREDVAFSALRTLISCPICGNDVEVCLSECGHLFCSQCRPLLQASGKCLVCRARAGIHTIIEIRWDE
jgi:hypothetical protein